MMATQIEQDECGEKRKSALHGTGRQTKSLKSYDYKQSDSEPETDQWDTSSEASGEDNEQELNQSGKTENWDSDKDSDVSETDGSSSPKQLNQSGMTEIWDSDKDSDASETVGSSSPKQLNLSGMTEDWDSDKDSDASETAGSSSPKQPGRNYGLWSLLVPTMNDDLEVDVGNGHVIQDLEGPVEDDSKLENEPVSQPILYWSSDSSDDATHVSQELHKTTNPLDALCAIIKTNCCEKACLQHFSPKDITMCHQIKAAKGWVLERVKEFRGSNGSEHAFVALGRNICPSAWRQLHGISGKMFQDVLDLHDQGVEEVVHGNKGIERSCPKRDNTIAWLQNFVADFGEEMPHVDMTVLPSALTKFMVFRKMYHHYHSLNMADQIVRKRQFYAIWNRKFRKVVIKPQNMFTKCTYCTVSATERTRTLNKETRQAVDSAFQEHLQVLKRERLAYERHKEKARQDDRYLCICIDGMDQSKTTIPHVTTHDKNTKHLWSLHTHVTGALVHGNMEHGKKAYAFVTTSDVHADSNLTLHVLLECLTRHAEEKGVMPEVLYLQFDNCWRENKNMYVLGFCFLLVELRIVKKVKINFLLVGHTHNDVDQIFSRLAEALRREAALTMDALLQVLISAYEKPQLLTTVLDHVFDFKSWLKPHFAGTFANHSAPHNFRIKRINGCTVMHYRKLTGDRWEPTEGTGLKCLETLPDLTDVPSWATPNLAKLDIPNLETDIPKFFYRMEVNEQNWWKQYLSDLNRRKETPDKSAHWPMMTIASTAQVVEDEKETENTVELPPNLKPIWDKLNKPLKPVTIGSQGKPQKKGRKAQASVEDDISEVVAEDGISEVVAVADANCSDKSSNETDINDLDMFKGITKNMMIGVYVDYYWKGSPQIGSVYDINMEEETVTIHWYSASWSGKCSPMHLGGPNRKPKTELLDIRCILLWDFHLTREKKALTSAAVHNLKKAYRDAGIDV